MKVLTNKLYRATLLDGLLGGLATGLGVCAIAAARHKATLHDAGWEFLGFIVLFVAWLGVNAWGIYLWETAPSVGDDSDS
jgi:hypothetical protein